jgi:hypothetical protein
MGMTPHLATRMAADEKGLEEGVLNYVNPF